MTFFVIIFSSLFGWLVIYLLLPFLRSRLIDLPNTRSSHVKPVPRGAGISFVLLGCASSIFSLVTFTGKLNESIWLISAPLIIFPLAIVGLFDDRNDISPRLRFVVQFITALVFTFVSPLLDLSIPSLPFILLLSIAVTAVINFINFNSFFYRNNQFHKFYGWHRRSCRWLYVSGYFYGLYSARCPSAYLVRVWFVGCILILELEPCQGLYG